jgi:hypothetical protein
MLKPIFNVTPSALNFNQASMKLMELTNPAQKIRIARIIKIHQFIFYSICLNL